MQNINTYISEKLKIKANISRMKLTEFDKTRKSLHRKENDFKYLLSMI